MQSTPVPFKMHIKTGGKSYSENEQKKEAFHLWESKAHTHTHRPDNQNIYDALLFRFNGKH